MSKILQVGDEESFLNYEEKIVYDLQKSWRSKEGMDTYAVMDMCARIEDLIYNDALREYSLSSSANVWSKKECIIYYQEMCDTVLRNLETKQLNWKKLFEDNERNPRLILQTIVKTVKVNHGSVGNGTAIADGSDAATSKSKSASKPKKAAGTVRVKSKEGGLNKIGTKSKPNGKSTVGTKKNLIFTESSTNLMNMDGKKKMSYKYNSKLICSYRSLF